MGRSSPSRKPPVAATRPLTQAHGLIRSQRRGQWLLPDLREVFGEASVGGSKVRQKCPLPTSLQRNWRGLGHHLCSFEGYIHWLCWLLDRFGKYETVVILIPLRLSRNVVLFENCQLIHWSSNKSSSRALVLMKNQGNNWGITMDRSWGKKSLCTNVVTFSDVKISASKRPPVLFTFQPVHFPHARSPLYFYSSLHSSPLISLKSEPFIASFTCFVEQRIAFSPFLIPCGYDVCVCTLACVLTLTVLGLSTQSSWQKLPPTVSEGWPIRSFWCQHQRDHWVKSCQGKYYPNFHLFSCK